MPRRSEAPRKPETPRTPPFDPVPRAPRRNGWTPARQGAFIGALEDTGSVTRAARVAGMSPAAAYQLRRAPGATSFAQAWDEAMRRGVRVLVDATMERAIHGVPIPVMYRGRQVATRRAYNDKLAMFHMRHRLPGEYGPDGGGGVHAARAPDTGRFVTKAEEQAAYCERAKADRAAEERLLAELRGRLDTIHAHLRRRLADDPAHLAAYDLLYGPGGPADLDTGHGAFIHAGRLPPPLGYAAGGVATDEECDAVNAALASETDDPAP